MTEPHPAWLLPSILAADATDLAAAVRQVEPVVDGLHIDVMDGHYVPNLSFGLDTVRQLRARSGLWFDAHLQLSDPALFGPLLLEAGADSITFHPATVDDPVGLVDRLHAAGGQVGVAVRPSEPLAGFEPLLERADLVLVMTVEPGFGGQVFRPDVVPKIEQAARWREQHGATWRLQVDGGIGPATIAHTAAAGADTFVAGTAVFGAADAAAAAVELLELARDPGRQGDLAGAPA